MNKKSKKFTSHHKSNTVEQNRDGSTPLHCAHSAESMQILLDNDASVDVQNKHGVTPLLALMRMYTQRRFGLFTPNVSKIKQMAELLISHKADVTLPDNLGITPLHEAALIDFEGLKWQAESAIHFLKQQKILLEHHSLEERAFKFIKTQEIPTGMIACAVPGPYQSYFESVNEYYDAFDIVQLLVEHGADVNAQTDNGVTPFGNIVRDGSPEIIEYFLTHGANPNVRDSWENTPLFYLVKKGDETFGKKLTLLVGYGADIMAKNKDGNTVLHAACYFANKKAVEFLINHNHPINVQNIYGATPLHQATRRLFRNSDLFSEGRCLDIIEYLLNKNAGVNIQDNYGWTVYQMALSYVDVIGSPGSALVGLLSAFGADKLLGQRTRKQA